MNIRKYALGVVATALVTAMAPVAASAATIQLGFILDRSGSIGAANWAIIVGGLANAVQNEIPIAGPDVYEVSVVSFGTTATIDAANVLVNSVASRNALAASIAAIGFTGGSTNFADAFIKMQDALDNSAALATGPSYVNFATDGIENDVAAGIAARNALIAAGVDNLSIEGIGAGVDVAGLMGSYCFPGPCDNTVPFNFPAQGFYIGVANAQGYADAISNKIRVVTGVPEPTMMSLLGLGLAGLAAARRRKA